MPRKTSQELAEHHKALAEQHRVKAIVAGNATLKRAIQLREDMPMNDDIDIALEAALTAFIDERTKA